MKNGVICFMFLREVYRAYFIIILLFIGSMMNTSYAVSKSINKTLDQIDDKYNSFVIYSGDGYSIGYPKMWKVVHNPDPISDVYIGDSMGHIGFTVLYFETNQSVTEINKIANKNELVTLKSLEGYRTIYLFSMGGINQTHISYLLKKGNLIYNIKFGGQSRYIDASVVLIDKIIQTIKIK